MGGSKPPTSYERTQNLTFMGLHGCMFNRVNSLPCWYITEVWLYGVLLDWTTVPFFFMYPMVWHQLVFLSWFGGNSWQFERLTTIEYASIFPPNHHNGREGKFRSSYCGVFRRMPPEKCQITGETSWINMDELLGLHKCIQAFDISYPAEKTNISLEHGGLEDDSFPFKMVPFQGTCFFSRWEKSLNLWSQKIGPLVKNPTFWSRFEIGEIGAGPKTIGKTAHIGVVESTP